MTRRKAIKIIGGGTALVGMGAFSRMRAADALSPVGAKAAKTMPERLGFPRDAKLLIVHGDDLGMNHSANAASIKAFESGLLNSGSIMVPCPWFPEIAAYARSHPEADLGLHLTLTSEWAYYRWRPVLPKDRVPSLLDQQGYLCPATHDALHMDVKEVEAETRAQIERAKAFGIQPTHLDTHMNTLYQSQELFEVLLRVAHHCNLPIGVSRDSSDIARLCPSGLDPDIVVADRMLSITPDVPPGDWSGFYADKIKLMEPGVTELILHVAYSDEEMRATSVGHSDWGAEWRQREFEFVTSGEFCRLLQEHGIKLVTWREVARLIEKPVS